MDEQDTLMYQDIKHVVERHFADPSMESRLSWSIQTIDRLRAQVDALKAALNDIKRHQEKIAGDAWSKGGAWHIADKALREGE